MILMPGMTRCPSCGQFVYAIDDLVAVKPWPEIAGIPGCQTGFHHDACFQTVPWRNDYLALYGRLTLQYLRDREDVWKLLASDGLCALVHKPAAREYTLYFLTQGKEVPFFERSVLEDIRAVAAQPDYHPAVPSSCCSLARSADDWTLGIRESAVVELEFAVADFERIMQHGGVRREAVVGKRLDFGEITGRLRLVPLSADAPESGVRGTVENVEAERNGESVVVAVRAETWKNLHLTPQELGQLKGFVEGALAKFPVTASR